MQVALLTLGYPPYVFGGVETYVSLLARQLANNGVRTTVIAGWPKKKVSQERIDENLTVIRLPLLDFPIRSIWFQTFNRTNILKLVQRADIVHANSPQTSLLNSKLAQTTRLVTTLHGSIEAISAYFNAPISTSLSLGDYLYLIQYPLIKAFYIRDLTQSDLLIHVAKHVKNEAITYAKEDGKDVASKSEVVFAGIDLEQLHNQDSKKPMPDNLELAFVGRLFYPKGITYAVQALETLVREKEEKHAKLHIYGAGPLKNWLINYAKKKRLQQNIKIHGHVRREDLIKQLSNMHAALLPSLYEGCPYTVLEANALGVPVVSFSFAWSKEFIKNGVNGYISSPFDTFKLAENVLKAIKLNSAYVRSGMQKYDIHETAKKTIELYEKLLEGK